MKVENKNVTAIEVTRDMLQFKYNWRKPSIINKKWGLGRTFLVYNRLCNLRSAKYFDLSPLKRVFVN